MLGLTAIFNTLKGFLFILVLFELVFIYCAITDDFLDLALNCVDNKLISQGLFLSIEGTIRTIFNFFPLSLIIYYYLKIDFSNRENLIKIIKNIYNQITTLQLFLSAFFLLICCYYLNSLFSSLYNKYKHCKL